MSDGVNHSGLAFHHFGLAVKRPDQAFLYLVTLGYRKGATCWDPLQGVNLAMMHHADMPDVEVIWPGDQPSPIDNLIKGGKALIYHQCYTSADPAASIAVLRELGLDVIEISPPKPAVLFDGLEVSFYSVARVGVIEIIRGEPVVHLAAAK
ncbi:VOC family protein [Dongia sedimenti]|uniref:VOC family protein n=1 Tax=Dongia sedimenti TaxID=3064282 RepID=A0ABU0YR85_9PROT|nr:VOC family protein [Rhodospirillaceae bacterium R-7]